jgi:hypothetical protein
MILNLKSVELAGFPSGNHPSKREGKEKGRTESLFRAAFSFKRD